MLEVYPEAEADGVEGFGTHLGPRPASKLLPVGDVQDGFVGPAVEGFSSTLQKDFLLTAASREQSQQGRSCEQTSHDGSRGARRSLRALKASSGDQLPSGGSLPESSWCGKEQLLLLLGFSASG